MEIGLSTLRGCKNYGKYINFLERLKIRLGKILHCKTILKLDENDIKIIEESGFIKLFWQDDFVGEIFITTENGELNLRSLITINVIFKKKYEEEYFVLKKIFEQTKQNLILKGCDLNNFEFKGIGEFAIKYLINVANEKLLKKVNILNYNNDSIRFYYKILMKLKKQGKIQDFDDVFWERKIIIHL